jgi:hypothetical protein
MHRRAGDRPRGERAAASLTAQPCGSREGWNQAGTSARASSRRFEPASSSRRSASASEVCEESFAAELRLLDDLENRDDLVEEIAEVLALTVALLRRRAGMAEPGDTG